jgi:hypothetical protein
MRGTDPDFDLVEAFQKLKRGACSRRPVLVLQLF